VSCIIDHRSIYGARFTDSEVKEMQQTREPSAT
jgi:hypothetical protein